MKEHNASIISLEGIKLWQTTPAQLKKSKKLAIIQDFGSRIFMEGCACQTSSSASYLIMYYHVNSRAFSEHNVTVGA